MNAIHGFPYRTDGGENADVCGAQCIIGADGSKSCGEIIADEVFTAQVIKALNKTASLHIPRDTLVLILGMAQSYLDDLTSGLADGTYEAHENLDFDEQVKALEYFEGVIESNLPICAVAA